MPRPRKQAQVDARAEVFAPSPVEVAAEPAVEPAVEPEPAAVAPDVAAIPTGPRLVSVGVRNRCPWATVQSAGMDWGRASTLIPADDPRLPELRHCEWLVVTEV